MRRRLRHAVAVVIAALCGSGCPRETAFTCEEDGACVVDGVAGRCEPNGYCSFPDEECASGRRYGQQGPAEFAGVCVGEIGGSSSSAGSTTTTSSSSSNGSGSTMDDPSGSGSSMGTTTQAEEEGTSSTSGPPEPRANLVFITSASVLISANAVSEADALCEELAAQAGLEGTFVSWVSTSEVPAVTRLDGARGWVRPDGRPFADRPSDLVEGRIFYPPVLDEEGQEVRNRRALTGSDGEGTLGQNCEDWTDFGDSLASVGQPGATFPGWSDDSTAGCDSAEMLGVYCFGIDRNVAVSHEPVQGRLAFASASQVSSDLGLPGFDTVCATEAASAGFEGTFRALVASGGETALSRFDTSGEPWVNMFGVPLADTAAALAVRAHLDAPFNITVSGEAVGGSFWAGAVGVAELPSSNCADWSTTRGSGRRDEVEHTTDWFTGAVTACSGANRIICLQD